MRVLGYVEFGGVKMFVIIYVHIYVSFISHYFGVFLILPPLPLNFALVVLY